MVIASSTMIPRDPLKWRLVMSVLYSEYGSTAAVTGHHPLAPLAIKPMPSRPIALLERLYPARASAAPAAVEANRAVAEILGLYIDFINGSVFRRPVGLNPGFYQGLAGHVPGTRVQSPESRVQSPESESRRVSRESWLRVQCRGLKYVQTKYVVPTFPPPLKPWRVSPKLGCIRRATADRSAVIVYSC